MLKHVFSLLFIVQVTLVATAQDTDLFIANTIPPELKEHANAVVRLASIKIEVPSLKEQNTSYKRIVTVMNKEGIYDINASVSYDKGISIKNLGAVVYDQYGNVIDKFKKSDFKDVSALNDFSLYEDNRIKYLDYTPIEYPFTIEFNFETFTTNTAYIPTWGPLEGYYASTQKNIYEVIYNPEIGINKKEQNFKSLNIENNSTDGRVYYTANNLIAIKPEDYSPRFNEFAPHLFVNLKKFHYEGYVGENNDWTNLGKWMYNELLVNGVEVSESTQNEIKKLVEGIEDPIKKAKIVYKYVQDRTRYISVQEGIGGIQPIPAIKVDEVKYGDCKGLTNYTKALMDVVGVKANYSRVYASPRYTVDVDKSFVSFLGQTNHVILNIPNGEENVWLECTSQTSPFNYTANFTDDRDLFVIAPDGGKIVHTKVYSEKESLQHTKANLELKTDGSISASVSIKTYGYQYALHEGVQLLPLREQEIQLKDYWDYINNLSIDAMAFVNDKDSIVFTENVKLSAQNYATISGNRLLFQPNAFNKVTDTPTRYKNRALDFEIERGFTDKDEFTLQLDANLEIEAMPSDVSIETKFGSYSFSISKLSENKLLYKRIYVLNKGYYPKEDYEAFREFKLNVAKHDKTKIVLLTKT